MTTPPRLTVSGLPGLGGESTVVPARGTEMRNFLQARLQKNRAPPLVHSWDFWHDRQDRSPAFSSSAGNSTPTDSLTNYEERLVRLAEVNDVRSFWAVFNNFDISALPLRDSVHLFHKGVKPVWEDPRNERGGSWTFRVPKSFAPEFWKEVCMMAIGEQLQHAVESDRTTFRDDICGISLGVRFNSMLIQIWNRDGSHTEGIDRLRDTVLNSLSPELNPREGSYYYKKHTEHSGFTGTQSQSEAAVASSDSPGAAHASTTATNPASVTETTPPASLSQTGHPMSEEGKNAEPIEDMRHAIGDMKKAMNSLENRGQEAAGK